MLGKASERPRLGGREREFRSLGSRLRSGLSGPPGSALVIGLPGLGRSTFFAQLASRGLRRKALGPLADELAFCPLRLVSAEGMDEHRILGMMRDALDGDAVDAPREPCTEAELENALQQAIGDRDRAHVFLVDDFHLISQSPAFSPSFFSFLRYLGYNLRAGYVLTSQLEISEMALRQEVQASPFWNIFSKIRLRPLSVDDGFATLSASVAGLAGVSDEHVRALLRYSDGIPFLLAAVSKAAAEAAREPEGWHSGRLLERALHHAAPVLDQVWDAVKPYSKAALTAVVEGGRTPSTGERDALLNLIDAGFLDEDLRVPALVLRADWRRRLDADPGRPAADLAELPPLRPGLIARLLRRRGRRP
jgi:hypothetical protein